MASHGPYDPGDGSSEGPADSLLRSASASSSQLSAATSVEALAAGDLPADYAALETLDVRATSKAEQCRLLKSFGLNMLGKSGDIQRRLYFLKQLAHDALQFDLKHFDVGCGAVRRLADRLGGPLFGPEAGALEALVQELQRREELAQEVGEALRQISRLFQKLRKYEKTLFDSASVPATAVDAVLFKVRRLEEVLLDLRPPELRMPHEEVSLNKKWSAILGYTREQVMNKHFSHTQLQDIMRQRGLWRDEYENEDHLRRNMVMLLTRLMKEDRKRAAASSQQEGPLFPERFMEDQLTALDSMRPGEIERLARDFGLFPNWDEADYEMNFDLVEAKVRTTLERWQQRQRKAELSLEEIHRSLPTIDYERTYIRGSCGIVKDVPADDQAQAIIRCKLSKVGDSEIREIGIRSDGYFSWGEEDETEEAFRAVWHGLSADALIRERAKKLEPFLESRTPAGEPLRTLHLAVSEDETFPFDVSRNCLDSHYSSPYGVIIFCKPLDLVDDQGVSFKRLVLQFRTANQDVRQVVERMARCVDLDTQCPYRFGESGDVIAQTIELHLQYLQWAKGPDAEGEPQGSLADQLGPSLLHYTSSYLRTHVFSDLNTLLREKWERELDVRNKYTPPAQAEAKHVLLDMLLSAPEDKHVAVLTPVQLHYAFEDITKRTYHLHTSVYVERSNLHVILRSLCRLNEVAGTIFVFLHLTGTLSPFDLACLIDQTKKGSLRIFMTFSAALISSLTLIGKIADVRVSHHASTSPDYSIATYHQYSTFTDVGAVILANEAHFEASPAELRVAAWGHLVEDNARHLRWTACEAEWRDQPLAREKYDDSAFALIVTRDTAVVRQYYEGLLSEAECSVHLIDCKVDDLDSKLNQLCADVPEGPTPTKRAVPCLVVLNANMLSAAHRRNIASRACQEVMRFIFVEPSLNPQHLVMKFDDMQNQSRFLRGTVWHAAPSFADLQRTAQEMAKTRPGDAASQSTLCENALVCYRVLRLVFGSLVTMALIPHIVSGLQSNRLYDEVEKSLGVGETHTLTVSGVAEPTVLRDMIGVLQAHCRHGAVAEPRSLHEGITVLCLNHVLENAELEQDVTFEQFVCGMPLCEWLSQRLRVEAYTRSVLMADDTPPADVFGDWEWKDSLVARYPPGFNVHSLSLFAYFRLESDWRAPIEAPSYQGTVKDVIVSHEEMLLQTCIQRQELNWADVASQWRTFPYGVDFLMTLLSVYHQPLKLLANCGRKNLFHMMENISPVTHSAVLQRLRFLLSDRNAQSLALIQRLPAVAPFLSTLKWALVSSGHLLASGDSGVAFDDGDLANIIAEQIPITVRRRDSGSSAFIIPVLLKLAGPPDILYNQVGLREYFLGLRERETEDVLERADFPLGAATFDFVFHVAIRRSIKTSAMGAPASPVRGLPAADAGAPRRQSLTGSGGAGGPPPFVNHPFFSVLVDWLENAASLVECLEARTGGFLHFVSRFTASAFALLLSKANTMVQTNHLLQLVLAYLEAKPWPPAQRGAFVQAIAQAALQRTSALGQTIHFLLSLPPDLLPSHIGHPFIDQLLRSLSERDLAPLIAMYCQAGEPPPTLPVETNGPLRQLYVAYFSDAHVPSAGQLVDAHAIFHSKALSTYGNSCLFQVICSNAKVMESSRLLLFTLWALNPFQMCPIYPESDSEASLLRHLVAHPEVAFQEKVARNIATVSSFALYLCFPYYLDHQTLSDFDAKMHARRIEEQAYLIGQKGHTKWPSYQIRTHLRPLPQELFETYDRLDFEVRRQGRTYSVDKLDFDVSTGVSPAIMSRNLNALVSLMGVDHADTRIYLGNVCLAWFRALDIDDRRLCRWGLPPAERDSEEAAEKSPVRPFLQWIQDRPVNETAYTLHPLPSFLDLRVLKDKSCYHLFGPSFEEAAYTLQYFETFLYSVAGAREVLQREQLAMPAGAGALVTETQSHGAIACERTDDYTNLPGLASHVFGRCIRKQVDAMTQGALVAPIYSAAGKFDLGPLESSVHPFTIALAAMQEEAVEVDDQPVVDIMLNAFFRAAKGDGDGGGRVKEGLIHMALALRIGIFNSSLEDRVLQSCLRCGFAVAEQALNEMVWCVEHHFISMPTLEAARSAAVTVQRNDELPVLSLAAMAKWGAPPCLARLPETVLANAAKRHAAWLAKSGRLKDRAKAPQIFSCQTHSYAEVGHKDRKAQPAGLDPLQLVLAAKPAVTILCSDLLEITANEGFGVLRVRPGRECFLVGGKTGPLRLIRSTAAPPPGTAVVASFPNNGIAWDYMQDLPPLSTLICDGFLLKRSFAVEWAIVFAVWKPDLKPEMVRNGAQHLFRSWHILDCRNLFSFELLGEVAEFLLLMCQYVYAVHTQTTRDMAEVPVPDLLKWFRHHPQAAVLEAIEDDLKALLADALQEMLTPHKAPLTMEHLLRTSVRRRMLGRVFTQCQALFEGISFFDALVTQFLQLLARRSNHQLHQVLTQAVPALEPILGPAAMGAFLRINGMLEGYLIQEEPEVRAELETLRSPIVSPRPTSGSRSVSPLPRVSSTPAVLPAADCPTPLVPLNLEAKLNNASLSPLDVAAGSLRRPQVRIPSMPHGVAPAPAPAALTSPPLPPATPHAEEARELQVQDEVRRHWAHVFQERPPRPGYSECLERSKPQPHFGAEVGFGEHSVVPGSVVAGLGQPPPLLVAFLDQAVHKNYYHPVDGRLLAYLLHPLLLQRVQPDTSDEGGQTPVLPQFVRWLVDVLRSPLAHEWKYFFLNLCTGNIAEPPPEDSDGGGETSGTKVVAYCLARACPVALLRKFLSRACGYDRLQQFCERKMMRYGVYFCDCGTNRAMRRAGLRFETVDLGSYYASGTTTEDEYYLKIINLFSEFTTHVYVQGLPAIGDLFLKWCCEYTERCPWRFIFFEGTDSTWNFIENRDRCIYKLFTSPLELQRKAQTTKVYYTATRETGAARLRWLQLVDLHFPRREGVEDFFDPEVVVETNYIGDWETQLEAISERQELLLLLVSPPGAGKTHLVETTIMARAEQSGRRTQRIDCSNDELVELSLTYILNRKFPGETRSLLVADEFHMLDVPTKAELIRWCGERQHWLQVILIANRSDEHDQKLLATARRQSSSEDAVQLLNCRLRIEKVLFVYRLDCPGVRFEFFLTLFFRACRALFSDDAISLRNVLPVHQLLLPDGAVPKAQLAALLLSKLPHIGAYCATHFVNHVESIHKQLAKAGSDLTYVPSTSSPLQLLVFTGLLDHHNVLCSYKEFVARLTNAHKAHPCVRLAAWVHYVCCSVGLETPSLECLGQLEVIDQVGFPLILSEAGVGSLDSCLAFYKAGDYTDLAWMAEAIVHGHAMNWAQVRDCWAHHYISDPTAFSHLLSVCTDPEAVLNALSPKNLCLLINASDGVLSHIVLQHYTPGETAAETEESPYFAAAWFAIRNAERVGQGYSDGWLPLVRKASVLQVLKWASDYAFHLLDVLDDPEGRQEYCQQLLVRETNAVAAECRRDRHVQAQIVSLWSNIFAPLLVLGPPDGVPYDIAYLIAKSQHPPKASWPPFVQLLCNIAHGHAEPGEVDGIYDHPFFTEYLQAEPADGGRAAAYVPPEMLATFLGLENGQLSKRWQVRILTSPHCVLDEAPNPLQQKKNLVEGLRALGSRDDILVKGSAHAPPGRGASPRAYGGRSGRCFWG
eukprot:EG_transcript_22